MPGRRPFAELGQRDEAAALGKLGQPLPLRKCKVADVGHRPLRLAAEHIPAHRVNDAFATLFARTKQHARWTALITTLVTFAFSLLLLAFFDWTVDAPAGE